ncbi:MAG: LuxR C-terminal-related transcriptional regulator [Dehalogenimonas sp.]
MKASGIPAFEKGTNLVRQISIVLADENFESRQYIRAFLESDDDFFVKGETGNNLKAIARLAATNPDILVYTVGGNLDLEIVRLIHKKYPQVACIVLSRTGNFTTEEALRSGAKSVIYWNDIEAKLIKVVHDVADSRKYIEADRPSRLPVDYPLSGFSNGDIVQTLTHREFEIFEYVVHGLNNEAIAEKLSISRRTVELHRANMMRKLGLQNFQQQLIELARQRGLFQNTE